jgi:hypothetical protein
MEKLKPCLKCQHLSTVHVQSVIDRNHGVSDNGGFYVGCWFCKNETEEAYATEKMAIDAWNKQNSERI